MSVFKDIYAYFSEKELNDSIDGRKFYQLSLNEQKNYIEEELLIYLKKKLIGVSLKEKLESANTILQLVDLFSKYYTSEEVFDLVHFILNVVGNLQGTAVHWMVNEDLNNENIKMEFKNGKWDYLRTSDNINCVEVFNYVFNLFKNDFQIENEINDLLNNFLSYVEIPTNSSSKSLDIPSTKNQLYLASVLERQLKAIGVECEFDQQHCYVYAKLEGDKNIPSIGFLAHMDTSEDAKDNPIYPIVYRYYNGKDVVYRGDTILKVAENPELKNHLGETLITSNGKTLLGADDKAGIAEIMEVVKYFSNSNEPHGDIYIAFTPDEEIGNGIKFLDKNIFNPQYAYTVDGEFLGEISYENFNAIDIDIDIKGNNVHAGYAKNKMINAISIATMINSLLPKNEVPENTSGYEGYFHLNKLCGTVAEAKMFYIIRDFNLESLKERIDLLKSIVDKLNMRYGNCITITINEQYKNMREVIKNNMEVVEFALKSIKKNGIDPRIKAIRGGTDGADLSFEGIPCPNIGAGGHNFHSNQEYVFLEDMEKTRDILIDIVREYYLAYKPDKEKIKLKGL